MMTLTVADGGTATGSALLLSEADDSPAYSTYTVETALDGEVDGTNLQIIMDRNGSYFFWDFRLAGSVLLGSYTRYAASGDVLGRGHAEFRKRSTATLVGSWAASYIDTYATEAPEASQLALMTITQPSADGTITGTGSLRFAGENSRITFNVGGERASGKIFVTWSGDRLDGQHEWNMRMTDGYLFGTYKNFSSLDGVEARGSAMWVQLPD